MTTDWSYFIQNQPAKSTSTFNNLLENAYAPINNSLGLLAVTGTDAKIFLQGQLTCDLMALTTTPAVTPGALCNPKGRVKANFVLFTYQDNFFLILPQDSLQIAHKHLKKYALFSKVNLSDVSKEWNGVVYGGAKTVPQSTEYSISQQGDAFIIRYPSPHPFSLTLSQNDRTLIQWVQEKQQAGAIQVTEAFWPYLNTRARLANVLPETSGLFTPQMLALEKYHGVSFSKGCYIGQEIIARTQHLGKLKRHLQQVELPTACELTPGEPVVDETGQELGILLCATPTADGMLGLAVIEDRGLSAKLQIKDIPIQVTDNN